MRGRSGGCDGSRSPRPAPSSLSAGGEYLPLEQLVPEATDERLRVCVLGGEPGSMWSALTPEAASHRSTARAMNSGPKARADKGGLSAARTALPRGGWIGLRGACQAACSRPTGSHRDGHVPVVHDRAFESRTPREQPATRAARKRQPFLRGSVEPNGKIRSPGVRQNRELVSWSAPARSCVSLESGVLTGRFRVRMFVCKGSYSAPRGPSTGEGCGGRGVRRRRETAERDCAVGVDEGRPVPGCSSSTGARSSGRRRASRPGAAARGE